MVDRKKSLAIEVTLQPRDKTLTDEEILGGKRKFATACTEVCCVDGADIELRTPTVRIALRGLRTKERSVLIMHREMRPTQLAD